MNRAPSRTRRWIIVGLAMPLLLTLLWISAERTYAGILDYFVERALTQWESDKHPPPLDRVRQTMQLFEDAIALTPNDPRLLARGARLNEWIAWHARDQRETYRRTMQRTLELYRRSLHARPGWPYTWIDFAAAKAKVGELDEEFNAAFRNALELGPWEMAVQTGAANLGLKNWRRLSHENRELMDRNIANAMAIQESKLFNAIRSSNNLHLFCFAFQENPRIAEYCEKQHIY